VSRQLASQQAVANSVRAVPAIAVRPHVDLAQHGYRPMDDPYREYDLFLSHATEDKGFVRPIVAALRERDVQVWYDEHEIVLGDSLRESIDRGLTRSRFGVVILSEAFFAKRWTNYELNGMVSREIQGRKVILPIWHPDLSIEDLLGFSPSLADKKALVARNLTPGQIADELAALILGG
jgi:hypothetical protein